MVQFAFNDKCNPDDDALGAQIVKVNMLLAILLLQCCPLNSGSVNSEILLIRQVIMVPAEPIVFTLYI